MVTGWTFYVAMAGNTFQEDKSAQRYHEYAQNCLTWLSSYKQLGAATAYVGKRAWHSRRAGGLHFTLGIHIYPSGRKRVIEEFKHDRICILENGSGKEVEAGLGGQGDK